MPGYYVHLAACHPLARKNRNFECGVLAPDLLKSYFKLYGLDGAREKYCSIKTSEMPDFSSFEYRIQQKESLLSNDGMHYGVSSNPDILYFWNHLSNQEKNHPFYRGYLWHLLTDLLVYTYLDIDTKFNLFIHQHLDDNHLSILKEQEINKLHADWNKTNAKIKQMYPDVMLPKEIVELHVVKFIYDDNLYYVDWDIVQSVIHYMRSFYPLNEDIDVMIGHVMCFVDDFKKRAVLNKSLRKV